MTPRLRLSRRARIRVFDRANGRCHICGLPILAYMGVRWDVDHIRPLHLGGTHAEMNLAPVHESCHAEKNADENPIRTKADRRRAAYLGIKKSGRKLPGGKESRVSKTIRGAVVARQSQAEKHKTAMAKRYGGEIWRNMPDI